MNELPRQWTFALVDLAGFTALTEAHGDETAADLATDFAELAERHLGPADRLVKTIGDAVLLASECPAAGLGLVRGILDEVYQTEAFPIARVGLHHGEAVERRNDMYGAAINLTARIAAQAAGGQVLATSTVAESASADGIVIASLGEFTLRNVAEVVELWELALCGPPAGASVDPVCRMLVHPASAAGRLRQGGVDYWFCSLVCAGDFAAAPERYAQRQD